jgi:tetratricopeptide (TPR) repeat protein
MIVKDEAARLPACLDSVAGAVDEMVIVDTGSTDDTVAVARARGARVVSFTWRDDFAAARNESLRHARGDWALVLDADERLALGAPTLRDAVAAPRADGLDCRLVSALPPGEPSPTIAAWYCRLFRRSEGVRFDGRVHEQIAPSIVAAGGRVARGPVTITHLGYAAPSAAKVARNLRLLRQQLGERPGHAFTLLSLGLTLVTAGDWREASDVLERALVATPPLARDLRAVAWMKLAEARAREGRWSDTAGAAQKALAEEPGLSLARYTLGRALFEAGEVERAAAIFEDLMDAPTDALGMTLHPHIPAMGVGLCRLRQRRFADAVSVLAAGAGVDATGETVFHLGNAYVGLGRLDEAAASYRASRAAGFRHADLERRLKLCEKLARSAASSLAERRRERVPAGAKEPW